MKKNKPATTTSHAAGVSKNPLVQLPNGSWVRPQAVTAVRVIGSFEDSPKQAARPAYVCVYHHGQCETVAEGTDAQAADKAAEVSAMINNCPPSTEDSDLANLQKRIGALNWKISGHVDAGGGIDALEKWIDVTMSDLNRQSGKMPK